MKRKDPIKAGTRAVRTVLTATLAAGSLFAVSAWGQALASPSLPTGEDETDATGIVESRPADALNGLWVISGDVVHADDATLFETDADALQVGTCVEVSVTTAGGSAHAVEISAADMEECQEADGEHDDEAEMDHEDDPADDDDPADQDDSEEEEGEDHDGEDAEEEDEDVEEEDQDESEEDDYSDAPEDADDDEDGDGDDHYGTVDAMPAGQKR